MSYSVIDGLVWNIHSFVWWWNINVWFCGSELGKHYLHNPHNCYLVTRLFCRELLWTDPDRNEHWINLKTRSCLLNVYDNGERHDSIYHTYQICFVELVASSVSHADSDADEPERFTFFWNQESPFSQWYSCRFSVDGVEYNCAEQYMMHQKARELIGLRCCCGVCLLICKQLLTSFVHNSPPRGYLL